MRKLQLEKLEHSKIHPLKLMAITKYFDPNISYIFILILELGKQSSDPIYVPDVWEVGNFLKTASDRSIDT